MECHVIFVISSIFYSFYLIFYSFYYNQSMFYSFYCRDLTTLWLNLFLGFCFCCVATINITAFLIYFSASLLLAYRNTMIFEYLLVEHFLNFQHQKMLPLALCPSCTARRYVFIPPLCLFHKSLNHLLINQFISQSNIYQNIILINLFSTY